MVGKLRIFLSVGTTALIGLGGGGALAQAQSGDDAGFARQLWQQLRAARMVGDDAIRTRPYQGTDPHGAVLEYLEQTVSVGGTSGLAIVKRNYGGQDVSVERVWRQRDLRPETTVMFRREGYDPQNANWFWAKYNPDGSVDAAGKVDGCIGCHRNAAGGDYVYSYNLPQR
ncbi:MAG TPA: cytochrome P460 family protein [Falsiroseomonas sp.]|jgi:hypothetical protein|nr:cytochrome P460 family protein [Falsiroseomonas sp.]